MNSGIRGTARVSLRGSLPVVRTGSKGHTNGSSARMHGREVAGGAVMSLRTMAGKVTGALSCRNCSRRQKPWQVVVVTARGIVGVDDGHVKFLRMERTAPRATTARQAARITPTRRGATTTMMALPWVRLYSTLVA